MKNWSGKLGFHNCENLDIFEFSAALSADDNNSYSHKWMGIMIGKVSALDGTKQQLIESPKIKVCEYFPGNKHSGSILI